MEVQAAFHRPHKYEGSSQPDTGLAGDLGGNPAGIASAPQQARAHLHLARQRADEGHLRRTQRRQIGREPARRLQRQRGGEPAIAGAALHPVIGDACGKAAFDASDGRKGIG